MKILNKIFYYLKYLHDEINKPVYHFHNSFFSLSLLKDSIIQNNFFWDLKILRIKWWNNWNIPLINKCRWSSNHKEWKATDMYANNRTESTHLSLFAWICVGITLLWIIASWHHYPRSDNSWLLRVVYLIDLTASKNHHIIDWSKL